MKLSGFSLAALFSRQPKLSLGLDIGSHAVKICELAKTREGYRLVSMGSARLPAGAMEDGILQDPAAVGNIIASLVKNLKVKSKKVAISISGYSVIVKKINLAVMDDAEMEKHIHAEAEQYIPFDIDDVYLDFQNLHTNTEEEDRTDVMLVAAKKEVVNGYLEMLQRTGLTASIIDVDAFALENSFEENVGLSGNVALVDIGASKMNINIIANGTSILARDVAIGSRQITERLTGRLDIDIEEAEELKLGVKPAGDNRPALEDIFLETCNQWVNEIRRALDFFEANNPGQSISRIILSGGGARVRGLDALIARECGASCEIFNPFARITYDTGTIDPEYLRYMAPEMAIAVGLATRPVEL